jgi:DNA-binding MarR family transcriptional regulator
VTEKSSKSDRVDAFLVRWTEIAVGDDASLEMGIILRARALLRQFELELEPALGAMDLHPSGAETLQLLLMSGEPYEASPTEIARSLGVTTATMTNRLDQLEKRGLLERKLDQRDRRALVIRLTKAGKDRATEAAQVTSDQARSFFSAHDEDDLEKLGKQLRRALKRREG